MSFTKWAPLKLTIIALPRSCRLPLDIRGQSYPKLQAKENLRQSQFSIVASG
jgi:hypothetical protein